MAVRGKRGEAKAEGGGGVRLRVVALILHDFYEEAEVCAVQVGCAAAGIRRGWVEDLASYGGQGEDRRGREGEGKGGRAVDVTDRSVTSSPC